MLDNLLSVVVLFSIVLLARTDGIRHYFETQSDGFATAKSPMDMFPQREIDNDLKMVDSAIREYWGLNPAPQNKNSWDIKLYKKFLNHNLYRETFWLKGYDIYLNHMKKST